MKQLINKSTLNYLDWSTYFKKTEVDVRCINKQILYNFELYLPKVNELVFTHVTLIDDVIDDAIKSVIKNSKIWLTNTKLEKISFYSNEIVEKSNKPKQIEYECATENLLKVIYLIKGIH